MTTTIAQLQSVYSEYQNFKNSLNTAQAALNNVIAQGTLLYNDAFFASLFPTTIAPYKTFLLNCQTEINSFISGFPVEPALSG